MKPYLLDMKSVLDKKQTELPSAYRETKVIPILIEQREEGTIAIASSEYVAEVPGSTIKQEKGLPKVMQREFDPRNLISRCYRCSTLANVYMGMKRVADEVAMKEFFCINCGTNDIEPLD